MSKLEPSNKPGKYGTYAHFYLMFDDLEHQDLNIESILPPELARDVQRKRLTRDPRNVEVPPTLFTVDECRRKKRKRA